MLFYKNKNNNIKFPLTINILSSIVDAFLEKTNFDKKNKINTFILEFNVIIKTFEEQKD